jgi:hypothetical protein
VPREYADEDQPPLLAVRTDPWLDRRHWFRAGLAGWREDKLLWWAGLGWRLQLQHLPHPAGVVALRGMPQAEVADLVEAARQHVLEEAAHELVAAQAAGSPAAGLAFLVLDRDRSVVEADDPGIGKSDAKDVAGEVFEHGLLAVAPRGDVEDPWPAPHRVGDNEVRAFSAQHCPELAAYQLGKSLDGYEEFPPGRMPGAGVVGDAAAIDQTMNVRVQVELLGPGVQHGEHGDGATDVTRIACEFDDRSRQACIRTPLPSR